MYVRYPHAQFCCISSAATVEAAETANQQQQQQQKPAAAATTERPQQPAAARNCCCCCCSTSNTRSSSNSSPYISVIFLLVAAAPFVCGAQKPGGIELGSGDPKFVSSSPFSFVSLVMLTARLLNPLLSLISTIRMHAANAQQHQRETEREKETDTPRKKKETGDTCLLRLSPCCPSSHNCRFIHILIFFLFVVLSVSLLIICLRCQGPCGLSPPVSVSFTGDNTHTAAAAAVRCLCLLRGDRQRALSLSLPASLSFRVCGFLGTV